MAVRIGRSRRVLIGVLAAMVLIAVGTVPSYGATKQFRLEVAPSSAVAGTSTAFTVKITNTTPGNSTINSFSVDVPFPLTSGNPPQLLPPPDSNNPNATATITVVGSQVRVQNIDSLKTNQFIRLRVTATPPALSTGCTGSAAWTAKAYAGNSLNGDQFTNTGTDAQRTTTLVGCVQLQFVSGFAPTNGPVATDMHLQVEAVAGGSRVTAFAGQVTIQLENGPSGAALSGNVATASGGVADFPNFQGDTVGDYEVKATSPGVTDSANAPFSLFGSQLDCDNLSDTFPMDTSGSTTIEFLDPADCTTPVPFTFSYDRATNTFTIEKGELSFGLEVTVVWPPEVVPGAGDQLQIPPTEVQPPVGFAPVEWCLGTGPSSWTPPAGEDWCIFSQQALNQGPSGGGQLMQVTDGLVLFGDANGRR